MIKEDKIVIAEQLGKQGLTFREIGYLFGVHENTIYNWTRKSNGSVKVRGSTIKHKQDPLWTRNTEALIFSRIIGTRGLNKDSFINLRGSRYRKQFVTPKEKLTIMKALLDEQAEKKEGGT